ncbi:MAG: tetratricopeptide repeat protein [bacterium]|nr:tetratricopeptide repeat protein [bacterium]
MAATSFLQRNKFVIIISLIFLIAAAVYIIAKRKSPEEFAAERVRWASAAMDNSDYEVAIALYEEALRKDEDLLEARFNLALAYEEVDRDKAVLAWEDYLARSEDDPSQRQWREQAELHLRRLKIEPIMANAAELAAKGKTEKAIAKYEEVLALDTDILDAHLNIARLRQELGDYEDAAAAYENALAIAPYSLKIRYETALVYEEFDRDKAIEHWEEFTERADAGGGIGTEKRIEGHKHLKALKANR